MTWSGHPSTRAKHRPLFRLVDQLGVIVKAATVAQAGEVVPTRTPCYRRPGRSQHVASPALAANLAFNRARDSSERIITVGSVSKEPWAGSHFA
jgi:hypothetical protein